MLKYIKKIFNIPLAQIILYILYIQNDLIRLKINNY